MAKGVVTPQDKRNEAISKIRDEGMTGSEAARQYNIGTKAIYSWMRSGVVNSSTSLILENNRLKKENEQRFSLNVQKASHSGGSRVRMASTLCSRA